MADNRPREIKYLAAMAGEAVDLPAPVTRRDFFFAKAAGMDVETPPPITREEKYLSQIQPGGGSLDPLNNPASAAEILDGKEAYSDQGVKIVGSLDVSLPALSNPAGAADIAYGTEAYDDQKQQIIGTMQDGNEVYF